MQSGESGEVGVFDYVRASGTVATGNMFHGAHVISGIYVPWERHGARDAVRIMRIGSQGNDTA
jgi:hypothetical protein